MDEQQDEDVDTDNGLAIDHNFLLSFSNYVVADYTFRISDSHGSQESICDEEVSNFIEYKLHFYRTATDSPAEQVSDYGVDEQSDYDSNDQANYDDTGTSIMDDEQWR